jgi:hypothetical protein
MLPLSEPALLTPTEITLAGRWLCQPSIFRMKGTSAELVAVDEQWLYPIPLGTGMKVLRRDPNPRSGVDRVESG